jgi:hypothetical protein
MLMRCLFKPFVRIRPCRHAQRMARWNSLRLPFQQLMAIPFRVFPLTLIPLSSLCQLRQRSVEVIAPCCKSLAEGCQTAYCRRDFNIYLQATPIKIGGRWLGVEWRVSITATDMLRVHNSAGLGIITPSITRHTCATMCYDVPHRCQITCICYADIV